MRLNKKKNSEYENYLQLLIYHVYFSGNFFIYTFVFQYLHPHQYVHFTNYSSYDV